MSFILRTIDWLEGVFTALGMGSGLLAPLSRFFFGGIVGFTFTAVSQFIRIGDTTLGQLLGMYNADGTTRPWALIDKTGKNPTLFPWWTPSLIFAILFGTFI
jgi:hypothetical protein